MTDIENMKDEWPENNDAESLQHSNEEIAEINQDVDSANDVPAEEQVEILQNEIDCPETQASDEACASDETSDSIEQQPINSSQQAFNQHSQLNFNPPATQPAYQQQYYQHPPVQQPTYAYPQDNMNQSKNKSRGKAIFLAIACILIVCVVGIFAVVLTRSNNGLTNNNNGLSDVPHVSAVSSAENQGEGLTAAEVYQKVFKSSVSVLAYKQATGELKVIGSGVICQEDSAKKHSYIVTCAHVINDSNYNIKVKLWDGSVHTAEVVNYDNTNDIGVIRIAQTGLVVAEFGNSDEIQPGATVYAIGSPYNTKFAGTFTRGMVSATNRLVTTQTGYQLCCIQHDTAINHGNSGGALINAYGQIIGINALKITADGYEGLGFAVPSSTVIKVINSIIENGFAPKTPKLGITYVQAIYYSQFLSDFIEENNLPAGAIVVAGINEDSSLVNTDLKENDIITEVNGEPLTTPDILIQLIQNSNVGDSFEFTIVRIAMNEDGTDYVDYQTFTVTASLVENKAAEESSEQNAQDDFYEYFGDDSGSYEDFYKYFYDYFYGDDTSPDYPEESTHGNDNQFTIPE